MDARKALFALALAGALAGCGQSSHSPSPAQLPLVPGSTVVVKARECNHGAHPYCSVEMVVQNRNFRRPKRLLFAERDLLYHQGWRVVAADTGVQLAAESPGHKWRVNYATALQDLKGIDLGWIARPPAITHALDRAIFDRVSTMSLILEIGSS